MQVHIVFERDCWGDVSPTAVYLDKDAAQDHSRNLWDAYVETMEVEDAEV
jgi:hypothetical protein